MLKSIGALQKRIIIKEPTDHRDYAGKVRVWSTAATVWARIRPLSARETSNAKLIGGTESHEITIRYLSGVNRSMRINFNNRIFAINGIVNTEERNIDLVITATEIINPIEKESSDSGSD